jgi:hypothetical protein
MGYQIILEGKGGELNRREVETEEEIRLELYRALIAAVDHLEGVVRKPACRQYHCAKTGSITSTPITPQMTRSTRSIRSSSTRRSQCGRPSPILPWHRTWISGASHQRQNSPRISGHPRRETACPRKGQRG